MQLERIASKDSASSVDWWLLPGTGFNVRQQVDKLANENDLESWFLKTKEDVKGFCLEYLVRLPVLPIDIKFSERDGQKRIVGSKYRDQLWIDTVSSVERDGLIFSSIQKIEKYLENTAPGSMAILTSPPGWSGYDGISYPDSQTYLFKVDKNGQLDAITVVSNMDVVHNKRLLEIFEIYVGGETEEDQIRKIVNNPIFLDGKDKEYDFEDALSEIELVLGSEKIRGEYTFSEARNLIKKRKDLINFVGGWNDDLEDMFKSFKEKVKYSPSLENVEYELGKLVLDISLVLSPGGNEDQAVERINYALALDSLKEKSGCNGGGKPEPKLGIVNTATGPRLVVLEVLCCTCPYCGQKVEAEIYDSKIHCPNCGRSA